MARRLTLSWTLIFADKKSHFLSAKISALFSVHQRAILSV